MNTIFQSFKPYLALPKSIHVIFFATIVNFIGNFVGPFLTLFLTTNVGLAVEFVGFLVAFNAFLGLIGSLIGGRLIDTYGRKKTLIIFRLLAALGYIICAFISSPLVIVPVLMLTSLLGGISTPVFNTIITDLVKGDERKTAFSLNYLAINIGFAIGPLLASFLYEKFLVWLFIGDAFTTILSVLLVWRFVPETKPSKAEVARESQKNTGQKFGLLQMLFRESNLLIFSFIIVLNFIAFSQFKFGLPLQVEDAFGSGNAPIFGMLMTTNAMVCFLLTIPITNMTKSNKASLNITLGSLFYALGFGILFFINGMFLFVISTILWSIGEILVSTNTGVYIADHAPITHRGRFNSLFPIIRRTGSMLGPILAGLYIKFSTIRSLWLFIGGLLIIAALMMYKLYLNDKTAIADPIHGID